MSFKNPIYPTIGWQFCSSKRSTCHTLITPQSSFSTCKSILHDRRIGLLWGFQGRVCCCTSHGAASQDLESQKKAAVRGCLWSLQWFCIPWEDTPDFPKPPRRNSFRNCCWRVRGIFQGYVGGILDSKISLSLSHAAKYISLSTVWCGAWWFTYGETASHWDPQQSSCTKSNTSSLNSSVLHQNTCHQTNSVLYTWFSQHKSRKKTRKTKKNTTHNTNHKKKSLHKNRVFGTRRPAGSYSAWSSRSSKSPPKHPTDFDAFDSMSSLDEFGFLTHQWSGYQ